jgi:hypothetical protein
MSHRRDAVVLLLILCALGGTSAVAAPCQPGSLADIYLQNGFACTIGQLTVNSFFFSETPGGIDPKTIMVKPFDNSPNSVELLFQGNFAATLGQKLSYVIGYLIDPPPPIIHQEQVDLDPTGMVTLQTALCAIAFPCPGGQDLGTLTATTGSPMALMSLANTNMLGVRNTLTLDGSNAAAASQGFDNITGIPEPAAILLTASGLLGLLAFRSRAEIRQVLFQLRS